jgi:hypothetical protein
LLLPSLVLPAVLASVLPRQLLRNAVLHAVRPAAV